MSPPPFLVDNVQKLIAAERTATRAHVTLTWAQSLDAKLGGPGGARVLISGPESMLMTHWLRMMHDAILIGVHTLVMDDPRLKIQLVPQDDPAYLPPQILILDPRLRTPPTARMLSTWTEFRDGLTRTTAQGSGIVRQPWIICGTDASPVKAKLLEEAGARIVRTDLDANGHIPPQALPGLLTFLGLRSVMIEGGSRVLASFLHAGPRPDGTPLVDSVVVTVAPMFIGEGISVVPPGMDVGLPELTTVHTETMGKDSVMVCAVKH